MATSTESSTELPEGVTRVRGGYRVEGLDRKYKTERGAVQAAGRLAEDSPATGDGDHDGERHVDRIMESHSDEAIATLRDERQTAPGDPRRADA